MKNTLKNTVFITELDDTNGGLKSLSLVKDPDHMNWVEGRMTWGQMQTWTGFNDYFPIPFKSLSIEHDCAVSVYENDDTTLTVTRFRFDIFARKY